ncbi:MAG: lipopolysaccharide transport periplasmic protein LptA [Halomonadaceae bacterium]|nr:MAG: lipopolysaccharide transport periplasmic protein LptA [Halomonadaceae bacterium]
MAVRHPVPGPLLSRRGLALMLSLALLSAQALAFDPESDDPINVAADSARLDERAGQATYRGNVVVTQGETRLEADTLILTRSDGVLSRMEALGEPARYHQPPRAGEPAMDAEAQQILYIRTDNRISFRRQAQIRQDGDSFRGNVIDYDISDQVVTASGGDEDSPGRVEMTIQPRREGTRE